MTPASTRPAFTTSAVNKFYRPLQDIISAWPRPMIFTPTGMSPSTFAARLRDSIKAVCDGLVVLDISEDIRRIRPELKICQRGTQVVACHRRDDGKVLSPAEYSSIIEADYLLRLYEPSAEAIRAVLVLASEGHLDRPVLLCGIGTTHPALSAENPDVAITAVTPTSTSIM